MTSLGVIRLFDPNIIVYGENRGGIWPHQEDWHMKKNHRIWRGLALLSALVLVAGSLTALADEPAESKAPVAEEQVPSGEDLAQGEIGESGSAATDEASEPATDPFGNWPVEIDKTDCSITLLLEYLESGETRTLVNGTIALFTVATVKVDNGYVFDVESGKFADVEAVKGIPSMNSEALDDVNATLARSLETLAEGREADKTVAVADGKVTFTG